MFSLCNSSPKLRGVPINDDCGEQVQPRHSVMLSFCRAVADFTLTPYPQRIFQGVMGLALIEANLRAALHVCIKA
jgi:hypothetical protein